MLRVLLVLMLLALSPLGSASASTDNTLPEVSMYWPEPGGHLRGTARIDALASDDVAVQHVELFANGVSLGFGSRYSPTSHIYYVMWDSTSVADGPVTLYARATDTSGNVQVSEAREAVVDNTAPSLRFVKGPPTYTNQSTVPLEWVGIDNLSPPEQVRFYLRLDEGSWRGPTMAEQWSIANLTEGLHVVEVKAQDIAGNQQTVPSRYSFTVDLSPPEVWLIVNLGTPVTRSTTVSLDFRYEDAFPASGMAYMQASHDGITWSAKQAYAPPMAWKLLPGDGEKQVYLRLWDGAGNVSAPARDTIILDTTPPGTRLDSGPLGYVASRTASFSFSSEAGARFECRLDAGAYTGCTSPRKYSLLSQGPHTFSVRAVDKAGNADPTPAVRTWTVDTVKPTVTAPVHLLDTTTGTASVRVALRWCGSGCSADITGYELQQSVDGGSTYKTVALPQVKSLVRSLAPGTSRYRFRVRARDRAGNWGEYRTGPLFGLAAYQETKPSGATAYPLSYPSGKWGRGAVAGAYGGYVRHDAAYGATARLVFTGKSVGWVSTRAGDRGKASVYLDGKLVAVVDLYSATTRPREVVFSRAVDPTTRHVLEVRVRKDCNTASKGNRADVDAFVVIR